MPTGYTAAVQSGEVTELKDFAMACARGFGALISLRDEPFDAPIPDEIGVSPWHAEKIREIQSEIDRLRGMSDHAVAVAADAWYRERCEERDRNLRRIDDEERRYKEMLKQVRAWEPPTSDHQELKLFMVSQLEESLRFDCNRGYWLRRIEPKSPDRWKADKLADLEGRLKHYQRKLVEETDRNRERNAWLRALRESL